MREQDIIVDNHVSLLNISYCILVVLPIDSFLNTAQFLPL